MKKFLFALGAIAMMVSCEQKQEGFTINGTAEGFADGTMVYINEADEETTGLKKIDSVAMTGGKFTFTGQADEIDMRYIFFGEDQTHYTPYISENGTINIVYDKDNRENTKVSGSENNDAMLALNEKTKPLQEKMSNFQQTNGPKFQQATIEGDTATVKELQDQFMEISDELDGVTKGYITENKNFVTMLLLGDLYQNKKITDDELINTFNGLDEKLKTSKIGKEIQQIVEGAQKMAIGKPAPDFTAPNPDGEQISLKENLGKVTVVDFWAAWCGPCRKENPHVVKIYEKYKDQGLNIVGVSLDRDRESWLKAIADDKLTWTQVSNVKFWQDPIAKEYNVSSIPATFILDAEGNIAAKDLRGQELDDKIAELLAK